MFSSELFSFQGRASRSKFWLVFLLSIFVSFVVILFSILALPSLVLMGTFSPKIASVFGILLNLLMIPMWWISIATSVKRFHDRGKSGWWYLIVLVPFLGALWLIIENGFLKGTTGANNFGEDTLAGSAVIQVSSMASPSFSHVPTSSGPSPLKLTLLIVGGVILILVLGRVIWAYQQVKSDEAKAQNDLLIPSSFSVTFKPFDKNEPLTATSSGPLVTAKEFNEAVSQIKIPTGIVKFTFINNPNGVQLFAYDIMSPSSRITIKAECPYNIIAKGVKNNGASYYELTQDQSPCSKEIEFIKPNGNGIVQPVSGDGQQIYVPGTYSDGVDFVKRSDDGSKAISFPVKLKVYGKDGNIMEAVTTVQVSGAPKITPRPVVVAAPITTNAPTATLTVGGVTNLVTTTEAVSFQAKWSSENADNFRSSEEITECQKTSLNKPSDYSFVGSGVSGAIDVQIRFSPGCAYTYTYTAENSKTGQKTTATATVKVN